MEVMTELDKWDNQSTWVIPISNSCHSGVLDRRERQPLTLGVSDPQNLLGSILCT